MPGSAAPRSWGHWTELKLGILAEYLAGFQRASKTAMHTVYLDLFAGAPDNVSRETGERIDGSARRAMDTVPPFTRLAFFELDGPARALRADLSVRYPKDKRYKVFPGDCNETIREALAELRYYDQAATIAFLDPYAFGVRWSTLEALATFKRPRRTKAEMFILLGHSFAGRMLHIRSEHMNAKEGDKFSDLYGCEDWVPIVNAVRSNVLSPGEFGDELVNLLRWRLQKVLGYKYTHTLPFFNTDGKELYDLVFATDHPAGRDIVESIYNKASKQGAMLREKARINRGERRLAEKGFMPLPFDEPPAPTLTPVSHLGYTWYPPRPPYGDGER